jgi:hypothetical protein
MPPDQNDLDGCPPHHPSFLIHLPMWINSPHSVSSSLHVFHFSASSLCHSEANLHLLFQSHTVPPMVDEQGPSYLFSCCCGEGFNSIDQTLSDHFNCDEQYHSLALLWSLQSSLGLLDHSEPLRESHELALDWSICFATCSIFISFTDRLSIPPFCSHLH